MENFNKVIFMAMLCLFLINCGNGGGNTAFDQYPVRTDGLEEMIYKKDGTEFSIWAPTAEKAMVRIYQTGQGGEAIKQFSLSGMPDGTWRTIINEDLINMFYTFEVCVAGNWLGETPGINAKAVGVNGKRGAVIDMRDTDPEGWVNDKTIQGGAMVDAIIYEMHYRDFSMDENSGITNKGKYLALTETGTINATGQKTGLDHLVELGVTHVHLLPSYDYASIDESALQNNSYNWGYDPQNYNVPEGSYSTDPSNPVTRIREFKEMVMALHNAGIKVVMDVVYNHTFETATSAFEMTVPGYFYRSHEDMQPGNASGCGNETASEREMMRKFMIESVIYWMKEYHVDGFRFDLMGIHDIETMKMIRVAIDKVNPSALVYGEGWAAGAPLLEQDQLAMKANVGKLDRIAAFSDELRDALRGPFNDDTRGAFLAGLPGNEESIKFGIVGAIKHPQIDNSIVNHSKAPWAEQPGQMISYVSCHDDMCLVDRLKSSVEGIDQNKLKRLNKLAQTTVLTSQGIPFIQAGEEIMRDKKGVHNSYKSPDSINTIDWSRKLVNNDMFQYYSQLIKMRREHPAFRMGCADMVRENLEFLSVDGSNLIAFRIKGNANGDQWRNITVILNSRSSDAEVNIGSGEYVVVCENGTIGLDGLRRFKGETVKVPAESAVILHE